MASPSRSGSVATKISVASFAAAFNSVTTFLRLAMTSYDGSNPSSMATPSLLFGQIADVAHRGHDLVVLAEIFIDGLRLCRRLDHDE